MPLWRIVPTARPSDTRWEDHPVFAEVVVRAESASQARLIAGRTLYKGDGKVQFGGEQDKIFISAFADEKLYGVSRLEGDGRFPADGASEVVHSQLLG